MYSKKVVEYFENPINFYVILTFSHITILYTLTGNPSIQFKIFPAKKDVYHTISDTIHISK